MSKQRNQDDSSGGVRTRSGSSNKSSSKSNKSKSKEAKEAKEAKAGLSDDDKV